MRWSPEELRALADLAGSLGWQEIPEEMEARGFKRRMPEHYRDTARKNKTVRSLMFGEEHGVPEYVRSDLRQKDGSLVGTVKANRPRSSDEMAELFDIDTTIYYPHDIITNQWANFWQTKVFWKRDVQQWVLTEEWDNLLNLMRAEAPKYERLKVTEDVMYLVEILDAHLGMMSWGPETGNDWDLSLALKEYRNAFLTLLSNRPPGVTRLVLRFGDDLLHYDKLQDGKVATTFKGTPQDIDSRYPKLYAAVAKMLVGLTLTALTVVPHVDIVMLPGNHDTHSVFTLGELLSARFHNDKRVTVDNEPREFKVYQWGANLIGMAHGIGNERDFKKLPDTLKQRARKAWGETKYAEIHTGDKHHEFSIDDRMVLSRKLKALCPNDKWHTDNQYDSYRGAQAFAYSKAPGIHSQTYYHSSFMFSEEHDLNIMGED